MSLKYISTAQGNYPIFFTKSSDSFFSHVGANNPVSDGDYLLTNFYKYGDYLLEDAIDGSDVVVGASAFGTVFFYDDFIIRPSLFGNSFLVGPTPVPFLVNGNVAVCPILVTLVNLNDGGDFAVKITVCGEVKRYSALYTLSWSVPSDVLSFMDDDSDRYVKDEVVTYLGFAYFSYGSSDESLFKRSLNGDFQILINGSASINLSDFSFSENPFLNGKVPLNALPFRAYEQIYNSFFRDERNNPLMINGKPYYDKYLQSTAGGADNFHYDLRRCNWEQDFLTTALPSPQQGQAPLVGISSTGVMTLSDSEGNVYHAQAITADDADTIVGAKFIKTNQDGTSIPTEVARSLVSYATSGISINDFRNVNALQRYLETNLRRGLKYRDLIASRWGVNISYSEMNMPEFIGGSTSYVNSAQVNQQSQGTDSDPLGSYAGQLFSEGKSKHKIRHFCDEPGFIIGVVSVVPVPVYSQLLPKIFTKFDQLDFFNPEFNHIGMQPIPMKEVAPLQVSVNDGNQDETFGYQRAWYDYIGRVDEVHGQFRGSLRDFVMYRTFSGIPRLSEDFLLVDNKPLDSVFSVQRDADGNSVDKILGQIYVDIVSRRPISRFGIPRLE